MVLVTPPQTTPTLLEKEQDQRNAGTKDINTSARSADEKNVATVVCRIV